MNKQLVVSTLIRGSLKDVKSEEASLISSSISKISCVFFYPGNKDKEMARSIIYQEAPTRWIKTLKWPDGQVPVDFNQKAHTEVIVTEQAIKIARSCYDQVGVEVNISFKDGTSTSVKRVRKYARKK